MIEFLRPVGWTSRVPVIDLSTAQAREPSSSGTVRGESEPDPPRWPLVALSIN